jgi:hypothetical protein
VGATGVVFAADELLKMMNGEYSNTASLLKAAVGAAVAIGAYELRKRAEEKGEQSISASLGHALALIAGVPLDIDRAAMQVTQVNQVILLSRSSTISVMFRRR